MKNISQAIRNALWLSAAVAILGGCSASTQSLNPVGQAPLGISRALDQHASPRVDSERVEPNAKRLEMFSGGKIHIRCNHHANSPTDCKFRTIVPGTAAGPYPGTFTAWGQWISGLNVGHSFVEDFTISSGSTQVTGSIAFHSFSGEGGPEGTYQYESSVGDGTAQVQAIAKKNLQETFSGM